MNKKLLATLAYVLAVVLVIIGIVYFVTPANHLPALMPGHDATISKVHAKHGIAAILLALGCVAFAWFQGGPSSTPEN